MIDFGKVRSLSLITCLHHSLPVASRVLNNNLRCLAGPLSYRSNIRPAFEEQLPALTIRGAKSMDTLTDRGRELRSIKKRSRRMVRLNFRNGQQVPGTAVRGFSSRNANALNWPGPLQGIRNSAFPTCLCLLQSGSQDHGRRLEVLH